MRMSGWSSDVCSSDLRRRRGRGARGEHLPLRRSDDRRSPRAAFFRRIARSRTLIAPLGWSCRKAAVIEAAMIAKLRLTARVHDIFPIQGYVAAIASPAIPPNSWAFAFFLPIAVVASGDHS